MDYNHHTCDVNEHKTINLCVHLVERNPFYYPIAASRQVDDPTERYFHV